jgi:hypothetical protein
MVSSVVQVHENLSVIHLKVSLLDHALLELENASKHAEIAEQLHLLQFTYSRRMLEFS